MARRPTRAQAAAAKKAAVRDSMPIRFTADYNHVEVMKTTAYKEGMVLTPPPEHRRAALSMGRAVVDGD